MFTMNVGNGPLFREIYEQGSKREAKKRLLRIIEIGLDYRDIELDDTQSAKLAEWPVADLDALAEAMMDGSPADVILEWLPKRSAGMDNNPFTG